MRLRSIVLAAATTALGCGSSTGPIVQPSPVPLIADPIVSCPSDAAVTAHNGQSPTVSFDAPTTLNGSPPFTVVCTPASGTSFANGTTTVTCVATDSRARTASCHFDVVVTPIPQLAKTLFLAFGDSLTEGKTSLLGPSAVEVPTGVTNFSNSYVEQLYAKLTSRYRDQTIRMVADGLGGEDAGQGKLRLQAGWSSYNPEVLLLLEGANDILAPGTETPDGMTQALDSVINALRIDIGFAKGKGARVLLATLPQMTPPRAGNDIAAVPTLNVRIKSLAVEQNVTLVDLFAAIPAGQVGGDGLHLTAAGYDTMANEWLKAITAALEVKPSTLQ